MAKDATAVQQGDGWVANLHTGIQVTSWGNDVVIVLLLWDEAYDGSGDPLPTAARSS